MKEIDMFFGGLFIGALAVALCCVSVLIYELIYEQSSMPGPFTQAKDALEQCERTLPRDQKCVIIAVPEDKK